MDDRQNRTKALIGNTLSRWTTMEWLSYAGLPALVIAALAGTFYWQTVLLPEWEAEAWQQAQNTPSIDGFEAYRKAWPDGDHDQQATDKLQALKAAAEREREQADKRAWQKALASGTFAAFETYISANPSGRYIVETKSRMAKIRKIDDRAWKTAMSKNTIAAYQKYLKRQKHGSHRTESANKISALKTADREAWNMALATNTLDAIEAYLRAYPGGAFAGRARKKISSLVFVKSLELGYEQKYGGGILSLAFSPDGKELLSAVRSRKRQTASSGYKPPHGQIDLWDIARGKVKRSFTRSVADQRGKWAPFDVIFLSGGNKIASVNYGDGASIWDKRTGRVQATSSKRYCGGSNDVSRRTIIGHSANNLFIVAPCDGATVLSASTLHPICKSQVHDYIRPCRTTAFARS